MSATQLIVALDYEDKQSALTLVEQLDPLQCALKVGSELFTRCGTSLVQQLIQAQFKVFLDLKFHDIPNTVASACRAAADLGVWMLNVHAAGGMEMMRAAHKALLAYPLHQRPLLIAVTVLTSINASELEPLGVKGTLTEHVVRLTDMAIAVGLDGVVCSPLEVKLVRSRCPASFVTVTPGIRLAHDSSDDQCRVTTPEQASSLGSDYIVMGRSITRAADPQQVIHHVLQTLSRTPSML